MCPLINDIRGYDAEHLDMVRVIAEVLVEKGISSGLIGVEFRVLPNENLVRTFSNASQIRYADVGLTERRSKATRLTRRSS